MGCSPERPRATASAGHAVGNLLLAAMTAIEGGDFEEGVRQPEPDPRRARPGRPGERGAADAARQHRDRRYRRRVSRGSCGPTGSTASWLTPDDVEASEDALAAIAEADLIVLGPGSLYTSVLPSLLIPIGPRCDRSSPTRRVCTCATSRPRRARRQGSTSRRTSPRLIAHTAPGLIDVVLANNRFDARIPTGLPRRDRAPRLAAGRVAVRAAPRPRRCRRPGERPPP